MSDSYQAIFDAVRSRINGVGVGQVMDSVLRESFSMADHMIRCVAQDWSAAAFEQQRPSVLFKPSIKVDGSQWCALYGDNLIEGVAGFGDSPADAMRDFDANWTAKIARSTGGAA